MAGDKFAVQAGGQLFQRRLENGQPEKEQGKAGQSLAERCFPGVGADQLQAHANGQHRQRDGFNVEAKTHQADQPAGHGGADVGADNDANGLPEGEQAGIDETDGGDGDRAGGLHQSGDQQPCQQAP